MLHQAEMVTVLEPETKTMDKARYPLVTHLDPNAKVPNAKVIPSMKTELRRDKGSPRDATPRSLRGRPPRER